MALLQITAADCAAIADVLETHSARLDIRLSPGSQLRGLIDDLRWLGDGAPNAAQPDAAMAIDRNRAALAFPRYEQALRIARALVLLDDSPAARAKVRLLKGSFDRLHSLDGQSQDALFELEVAGRLVARQVAVSFAEPDIVIFPGTPGQMALACKRPRRQGRLADCIRRAAAQIRQNPPGVIVVGVEALLQRDPVSGRPILYTVSTPEEFHDGVDQHLATTVQGARRALERAFLNGSVMGALFCGIVTAWSSSPSAYLWKWAHHVVPNNNIQGVPETLAALDDLMFGTPGTGTSTEST